MAFTEFCARSGGSNLNAGTRTGNSTEPGTTADFTYASGSWVAATGVFTVASGNPSSDGVAVGDFVSVYADGATQTGFIGRVTARTTTTITVSLTAKSGTAPVDGTNNRTLKVGGAWLGPNGANQFPFAFAASAMLNTSSDPVRVNLKNDATYSISAAINHSLVGPISFEGYSNTYGDGGKFIIDANDGAFNIVTLATSLQGISSFIIQNNFSSSGWVGLTLTGSGTWAERGVVKDVGGVGVSATAANNRVEEVETYDCNKSNTVGRGNFQINGGTFKRCIAHDSTTANSVGFFFTTFSTAATLIECIADTIAGDGARTDVNTGWAVINLQNCNFYKNGGDGLDIAYTDTATVTVENCNFLQNGGWGINGSGVGKHVGRVTNCGFGSGTQANTSGTTTGLKGIVESGTVNYAANVTPWADPDNGDYRITLAAAQGTGRGTFTQTAPSYTGTVGYPPIGAAPPQSAGGGSSGGFIIGG